MKSLIIQPSHVRGLGNILDNEDNIQGLHCRVEAQDTLVEFDDLELKTYYMGTGTQLNIRFILDTISILPEQTVHVDVLVTDDENNPVSGVDLYIYESNELISQMETDDDGYGVEDGSLGFNFTSEDVGKHTLKCVIPRQDLYYESKNELVINVLQETTLTLTIDPDSIDTLTDTITLYGTLLNEDDEPVVGEIITFYDNTTLLGWSITNDDGVATLVVNIEDIQDLGLVPTIDIDWIMTSDNPNNHTEDGSLYVSATISDTGISGLPLTILVNNTVMFEGVTDSTGHADLLSTTLSENAVVTVITQHTNLYNATTKQYRLGETEKLPTTTSLAVSSNTIYVDGSTTATATVTSGGSGVNGLTVTFKDGSTTLGTGTTNSSGVATYTVSGLSAGNHSITAVVTENSTYAASTSSAVTLTVNNHSYSLAFSAASYVATGGSATLECTLLDNNVPVEGATISVSGSDSSLYTGITNSSGTASITVSNISSETTFTASYGGATATCTVNVVSYLFRDGGVTGDVNTDYTNLSNADISVTTDSAGTLMKCASGYGDKFRKANTLISGDFEIKYTCISATVVYGSMRFLTTSNGNMFTVEQYVENDVGITIGNSSSTYAIGETITFPLTMTIQRVNGKLAVWYNDIQVASNLTVSTNDGYFSWKFYANDHREQKVKDLTIRQL